MALMKLTDVIRAWEELHVKDIGELGYSDLERAVEKVVGIVDDTGATSGREYPPMERELAA